MPLGDDVEASSRLSLADDIFLRAYHLQLHTLIQLTLLVDIQTLENVDLRDQFLALAQLIHHAHMQNSCELRSSQ